MQLPYFILILLPPRMRERHIQKVWNSRSDAEILDSHKDATGWLSLAGITSDDFNKATQMRLDKYIMPQMEQRGLPPTT